MAQILHTWRGAAFEDRNTTGGAIAPTAYDCLQFYDRGSLVIAAAAGGAFTLPAGLPIGFRMRVFADTSVTTPGSATVAFAGAYTVLTPSFIGGLPLALAPAGGVEIEIISSNRVLVTPIGPGVLAGGEIIRVATRTVLSTVDAATRYDGMLAIVLSDNSLWRFDSASALAADYTGTVAIPAGAVTAANLVLVPAAGTGRWIRADKAFTARIPFVQATANAAVLWTPPGGIVVRLTGLPFWNITAFVAGDGARRIGASASAGDGEFTNVGDLLGGTAGQLPVLGVTPGTVGDAFLDSDAANTSLATVQKLLMPPATGFSTVRYDIMAAGTDTADGMICIPVSVDTTVATIS